MKSYENVMVYPYDANFTPVLRCKSFVDSYKIVGLSSLSGWGLCGKDASYVDGGPKLNILVENKFEEYFNFCDTVIIAETDHNIDYEKYIYPQIFAAISAGKNIICLKKLDEKLNELEDYCKSKKVYFKNYGRNSVKYNDSPLNIRRERGLFDINTPVIGIVGISENTNKFSLQIEIKSHLEDMGYKVALVGSRAYCEFLGFNSFPYFMSDNSISEAEKIYFFNRYIKTIELVEKPDIIIIGVPGGIIPFNQKVNNNFGITAFEIFQSVTPDFSVVSIFHEMYTSEYFEKMFNNIKYRFGFEIDVFNLANKQIDWAEMNVLKPDNIRYFTLSSTFMDKRITECKSLTNIPVYNILNTTDSYNLTQILVDRLVESDSTAIM